jgi:hypothetical protein
MGENFKIKKNKKRMRMYSGPALKGDEGGGGGSLCMYSF